MRLPYKYKNLNIDIDVSRIISELESLGDSSWIRHAFHETGHDVISLISTNGTIFNEDGSPNHSLLPPFLPTEYLDRLPYTKEIVYSFGTAPHRTRFAAMRPNQRITPHRDLQPNWHNKVRVHIPIITDPLIHFHIWEESDVLRNEDRTDVHFFAGTAWVPDIWRVHAVTNFSTITRIHLIIDLEPRGKLFSLMFDDVEPSLIQETLSYEYPRDYTTDLQTLKWLTGGKTDVGKALWQTRVVERNPQVGRYEILDDFWTS